MNKSELVKDVWERVGADEVSLKKTEAVLDAFMDAIVDAIGKGDEVRIVKFGTFKAVRMAARAGCNPQTKERIEIPSKMAPRFVPGLRLKEAAKAAPMKD